MAGKSTIITSSITKSTFPCTSDGRYDAIWSNAANTMAVGDNIEITIRTKLYRVGKAELRFMGRAAITGTNAPPFTIKAAMSCTG